MSSREIFSHHPISTTEGSLGSEQLSWKEIHVVSASFGDSLMYEDSVGEIKVSGSLIPSLTNEFDLGSENQRWNEISLSAETLKLGSQTISETTNLVSISAPLRLARFTTAEINAISSPTEGMMLFNSDKKEVYTYRKNSWRKPGQSNPYEIDYLLVAGGGGGGSLNGGGGGAGGFFEGTIELTAGSYVITVGTGGAGSSNQSNPGSNGTNSVFDSITVLGGGGGSSDGIGTNTGVTGGSGGGGKDGNFGLGTP